MDKQHILQEIKRTAKANGGTPLGRNQFFQETGIRYTDWTGKFWVRWGDAVREAGFVPNQLNEAYDRAVLIEAFISLMRELGRFPLQAEIKMKGGTDENFPSSKTFLRRLGSKQQLAKAIFSYCEGRSGYEDVATLCASVAAPSHKDHQSEHLEHSEQEGSAADTTSTKEGYVYMGLLKLGREKRYKIGKAVLVERRTDQISLQLPHDLELVHTITTDDAYGIENYWHRRFATKNTKGEWFLLSRQDVEAFKRRKIM